MTYDGKPEVRLLVSEFSGEKKCNAQRSSSFASVLAFVFLTASCIQALYRGWGDPGNIAFVIFAYTALVLLFWSLHRLDSPPRDGKPEIRLLVSKFSGQAVRPELSVLAFVFLTVSCIQALYHGWGDPENVGFVISAYTALVQFFRSLRRLDSQSGEGSYLEEWWLKLTLRAVTISVDSMLSFQVTAMMPTPPITVIWIFAGSTAVAAFYALFIHREPATVEGGAQDKPAGEA